MTSTPIQAKCLRDVFLHWLGMAWPNQAWALEVQRLDEAQKMHIANHLLELQDMKIVTWMTRPSMVTEMNSAPPRHWSPLFHEMTMGNGTFFSCPPYPRSMFDILYILCLPKSMNQKHKKLPPLGIKRKRCAVKFWANRLHQERTSSCIFFFRRF